MATSRQPRCVVWHAIYPDWEKIDKGKQAQVLQDNERDNYKLGDKVLLKLDHLKILFVSDFLNEGP